MNRSDLTASHVNRASLWAGAAVLGAALTATWVERRSRRAERAQPPAGRLLDVDGVRLHVVERGEGSPVVLIHGNMVSQRDFEASGLMERLARDHRVIAFDRPGFGHSSRPRNRLWTPTAQAELLHAALAQLGVEPAVVVGHSMGAMVALALALDHPADVRRLVLLGGYYYPTARVDALLTAPVALPVLGDVMRYTVTAVSARLMLKKLVRVMFAPREVPAHFMPTLSRDERDPMNELDAFADLERRLQRRVGVADLAVVDFHPWPSRRRDRRRRTTRCSSTAASDSGRRISCSRRDIT